MSSLIYVRKFLAIGQRTQTQGFGEGHNLWAEIGMSDPKDQTTALNVLGRIDHRAIGLDLNLGFEPTLASICEWIFRECRGTSVRDVRLLRGDGVKVELLGTAGRA